MRLVHEASDLEQDFVITLFRGLLFSGIKLSNEPLISRF